MDDIHLTDCVAQQVHPKRHPRAADDFPRAVAEELRSLRTGPGDARVVEDDVPLLQIDLGGSDDEIMEKRAIEWDKVQAEGNNFGYFVLISLYTEGSKRDPSGGRLQGRGVSARLGAALAAAGSPLPSALVGK